MRRRKHRDQQLLLLLLEMFSRCHILSEQWSWWGSQVDGERVSQSRLPKRQTGGVLV